MPIVPSLFPALRCSALDWRGFTFWGCTVSLRVAVYVDYQNLHMSAHENWCDYNDPVEDCLLSPLAVAERIVAKRGEGGLSAVRVYRGRPDPRKQATLASANDKQARQWEADGPDLIRVVRRPLWYPHDWGQPGCYDRPREKGIDVQLAVEMVSHALDGLYDVGILVSRDSDLLPPVELIKKLGTPAVEVATWNGSSRLRLPSAELTCHLLSDEDFDAVRDRRFYGKPGPYMGPRPKLS